MTYYIIIIIIIKCFVIGAICRHNMTNRGLWGHATKLIKSKSVKVSMQQ